MIPRFVYGDSYGDVGNRELATDASRDSRYFNLLAAQRAAAQMADQKQAGDEQLALQYASLGQQNQNQNANLGYQYASMGQNADLFKDQLASQQAIAQMQLNAHKADIGRVDTDKFYNEAFTGIQNGSIASPTELEAFGGNKLTPEQKVHLTFYLNEAARERGQKYRSAQDAANALNNELDRRLAPYKPGYDKLQADFKTAPDVTDLKGLQKFKLFAPTTKEDLSSQFQMSPFETTRTAFITAADKHPAVKGGLVAADPLSGYFMPAVPPPRSFVPPGATRTPAIQGGVAPAGTPFLNPGPSSFAPVDKATWVSIPIAPGHFVRVDPRIAMQINTVTKQFRNDMDKEAYTQRTIADTVKSGMAEQITPGTSVPAGYVARPQGLPYMGF